MKEGIVNEVINNESTLIVYFEDGTIFTSAFNSIDDIKFGEIKIERSIWSPVREQVISARRRLIKLGLINLDGVQIKPKDECTSAEVEEVALYLALEAGVSYDRVATFE